MWFISVFSVNKSYSLILYQKFLSVKRKTIDISPLFVYSSFAALPLLGQYYSIWNFVIYFHLRSIFDMLNNSLFVDFFSTNFSKETAKLFPGSARTSANNSRSFSVHCLVFFVVLHFLYAMITCSNLLSYFLW